MLSREGIFQTHLQFLTTKIFTFLPLLLEQINCVCRLKTGRLMRSQLDDFATYQLASFYILLPVLEMPPYQMALIEDVLCYTHLSSRNARVRA